MSLRKAILITLILLLSQYGSKKFISYHFGYISLINVLMYLALILLCYDFRAKSIVDDIFFIGKPLSDLFKAFLTSIFLFFFIYSVETTLNVIVFGNIFMSNQAFNLESFYLLSYMLMFPFLEELLFRKGILNKLLDNYSAKKSIVYSALMFAFAHFFTKTGLISAFLTGLIFGGLYYKFRSFIIVLMVHVLYNTLVLFMSPLLGGMLSAIRENLIYYSITISILSLTAIYGINRN